MLKSQNLKKIFKLFSLIALTNITITTCHTANFSYKNGPRIKSADSNFELGLNGRGHFDTHLFYPDEINPNYPAFGSQLLHDNSHESFNWRRSYATITGKIHDVNFKFENDFAINATTAFPHSLREAWIAIKLGIGQLTIGQFKPYRGLEEMTSSNEITLMERPSTSSTGIYSKRQFLTGIGYRGMIKDNLGFGLHFMSLSHFGLPLGGISYGGRVVWLPVDQENHIAHLGLSISRDTANQNSLTAEIVDIYGGRQGISQSLGSAGVSPFAPNHNSQSTFAAEIAYAMGSLTLQGEFALARLDNTHQIDGDNRDSTIQAFYSQVSWFITGETAVYRKDRGAFGKPQPKAPWGAIEFAGRYDLAENLTQSLNANPCNTGTSKCQVQIITLGVNWYPYSNIRLMLNYYLSDAMTGHSGHGMPTRADHFSVLSFRTQISF